MSNLGMVAKVRVGLILLVMFLISSTAWAVATPVKYIDENGDVQEITDYTKVAVNDDGVLNIEGSGWYVVKGSIYATKAVDINTNTDVNLVLTDSSELTIDISADSTENQTVFNVGRLAIYSQEDQSGKLTLKSSANDKNSYGIAAFGDVIIAGGYVKSTARYAIYTVGKTIRIIRGTVSVDAPAKIINSNGLNSKNIIIDGGRIFANSTAGIFAENNLSINGGYIDITGKNYGCFARKDFFMTDGSIRIQAAYNGIYSYNGNIYISGGSIDATTSYYQGTGLIADKGKIVVSGGSIDLSEQYINGISAANDSLVLGWTNTYDYIKSPGFSSGKAVVVGAYDKDGTLMLNSMSFKDEKGNGYIGDITGNLKEIQNKTLTPAYKIAFETGDKSVVVNPLFVGIGETPIKPANPMRMGYTFVDWYTDKDLKTEFDWNEKITQDITLYAKWSELPFVKYIDEYGKEQQTNFCEELTSDTDVNNLASGWYVVKSGKNVVLGDIVNLKADYKIILEDGSHLTVDSIAATNVAIYGQKEQTGTLSVSQDQNTIVNAVLAFHTLAIYGGDITVGTSENQPEAGLVAGNTAIIAGGSVSVFAKYAGLEAASVNVEDPKIDPGVHITGGEVSITVLSGDQDKANAGLGFGVVTNNKAYLTGGKLSVTAPMGVLALDGVVLDWTNESDFYTVGDYNIQHGVLSIADGKALKDENGDLYYGQYDVKNISIFNGKTLSACDAYGIEFVYDDKSETKMFVSGSKPQAFSPVLPGFKFLGWFTSKEQNAEKFDFDVARTESAVVYAKWEALAPVDYIDENGETQTVTDYIELVGGEDPDNDVFKKGGWFVVKENVTYGNDFVLGNSDVHLILADGVKLTVDVCAGLTDKECDQKNSESDESQIYINNLFIYAQSLGENMGQFIVRKYKEERAFVVKDSLVVNGGVVDLAKGESGVTVKELVLNNGKIQISDVKTGINARDVVAVRNGSINISNCEKGFDIENFKMTDGNVTVSCKEYGFDSFQFMIDGGTVDAIASVAVKAYDSLVVNGGSIKAYAIAREVYDPYKTGPYAIYSQNRNIYLNGGYVSADGDVTPDAPQGLGIVFGCSIYLNGGTIKGQRYFMSPDVEKGLQYSDEDGHSYTGTVDSREIAGKTLFPVKPIIDISYDQSGAHATINANYIGEDPFVVKYEIEVADVKFERDFTTEGYSTVVLPFNVKTSNLVGIDSVLSFAGVVLDDNNKKAVAMQVVWEKSSEEVELQAYTPYMVKMNKKALEILGSVMLEPNRDAFTEKDGWEFRGTYSFMKWTEDSPDLGRVYAIDENGTLVQLKAGDETFPLQAYVVERTFEIADIENQFYTGNEITPELVVTSDGNALTLNKDYTVEYSDNKNEGTASVTVRGIGYYASLSPRTVQFEIVPPYIVNSDELNQNIMAGSTIETVTIVFYGASSVKCENLPSGLACGEMNGQFKIFGSIDADLNTGDYGYRVVATMENGEEYVVPGVFSVTNENGTTARVVENETQNVNVGKSINQIGFKFGGTKSYEVEGLPDGAFTEDYAADEALYITGTVAKNAVGGIYSVRCIAIGETYRDTAFATVVVNKSLTDDGIAIGAIADQEWTDKAVEPEVSVTDGKKQLVKGRDYTLSYSNNVEAGEASVTVTGKDIYSGSLTTTFEILTPVKYLDETGKEQSIALYHKLTGKEDANSDAFKNGGWYLVEGEVTFDGNFGFYWQEVSIILADNAKLTVSSSNTTYFGSLAVYAQSTGKEKGQFVYDIKGGDIAWYAPMITINGGVVTVNGRVEASELDINGGDVTITSRGAAALTVNNGNMNVNGGTLTAGANIKVEGKIYFNGGFVSAEESVILATAFSDTSASTAWGFVFAGGTVKASAFIMNSSAGATATIADGLYYTDGEGNSFSGTLTDEQIAAIADKTIHPYIPAIQSKKYVKSDGSEGTLADFNGNYGEIIPFRITESMKVDSVEFKRSFVSGQYVTVMFPFNVYADNLIGAQYVDAFDKIDSVKNEKTGKIEIVAKVANVWKKKGEPATICDNLSDVCGKEGRALLMANHPYMVQMEKGVTELKIRGAVELKTNESEYVIRSGDWEIVGMYHYKKWAEDDSELLNGRAIYGFVGEEVTGFEIGTFVRCKAGVYINPMRAYMRYNPLKPQGIARYGVANWRNSTASIDLPESIIIVRDGNSEAVEKQTTTIGQFNTRKGEIKLNPVGDRVYDLKGRSIRKDAKKAKGAYYGKKE